MLILKKVSQNHSSPDSTKESSLIFGIINSAEFLRNWMQQILLSYPSLGLESECTLNSTETSPNALQRALTHRCISKAIGAHFYCWGPDHPKMSPKTPFLCHNFGQAMSKWLLGDVKHPSGPRFSMYCRTTDSVPHIQTVVIGEGGPGVGQHQASPPARRCWRASATHLTTSLTSGRCFVTQDSSL